jgi:hypothetical protein
VSATGSDSLSDTVAIITAVLTLLAIIVACAAAYYSAQSVRWAKAAVDPLEKISAEMLESAKLQRQILDSARQLRNIEWLTRRVNILERIVNSIATIAWLGRNAESEALANKQFNQERQKLVIALSMLPKDQLPATREIVKATQFTGVVLLKLTGAGEEADRALTHAQNELAKEAQRSPAQS